MSRAATICFLVLGWFATSPGLASDAATAVGADLQAIYARTQAATSEEEFTEIARACSKIIPDLSRSAADKAYASKLFAWALNRRGEVRGESAARMVHQGQLAQAQETDKLAGKDFALAAEHAPDNWRVHHNLAIAHAMQGKYDEAIDAFTRVIALKDDYPNAYYNRAELHFEREHFAQAVTDYSMAIDLAPGDARYHNGRAHASFMLNNHQAALVDYTRAAALEADNAAYLTDLADALQSLGQWEDAATRYRQAIAADKTCARAFRNIAWLLSTCPEARFRNPNLAVSAAQKAIELSGPDDFRALDTLATATAAAGDPAKAARLMQQAIAVAPPQARPELTERSALYAGGGKFVQGASLSASTRRPPGRQQPAVRTASANGPAKR